MNTTKTVVGVDTSKRIFQLYWVEPETGECMGMKLTRAKYLEHFANRSPCLVAMEACGGSQHWARQLVELGHEVRLIPAKKVRPFVGGNKSDAHDARAIWTAVQQPGLRTVNQERRAAGGTGAAPQARTTGEVPHGADQRHSGPAGRVR